MNKFVKGASINAYSAIDVADFKNKDVKGELKNALEPIVIVSGNTTLFKSGSCVNALDAIEVVNARNAIDCLLDEKVPVKLF